jgi:hypothetical protein
MKKLTRRCHKQFGDVTDRCEVYIPHSLSPWVTHPVVSEYLACLRGHIPNGLLCLVMEQYPARVAPESENEAHLGIRLVIIPKRATGFWQSLDRRISEAAKAKVHARCM